MRRRAGRAEISDLTWVFAVDGRQDRLQEVVRERREVSHGWGGHLVDHMMIIMLRHSSALMARQ